MVEFDNESKIQRIRIYWDQASLLRQVDVIGSRGKNWPITDGKDQARLIASALLGTKIDTTLNRGRGMDEGSTASRSISPSKKRIQDPHSSLALFFERSGEENPRKAQPAMIPPRDSAKPAEREYSELFAAGNEDCEPDQDGSSSPKKPFAQSVIAPKGAGASKFQPSRLFEENDKEDIPRKYQSNPAKFNHFELGEAEEHDHFQHAKAVTTKNVPMRATTNKHLSQWDFEDFVTPEKVRHRVRGQDVRHFGWSDDEGEKAETPGKQPKVVQPRRDAEAHFEFKDDGTPDAGGHRPTARLKGNDHQTGLGLYQNNLYDDGLNGDKAGHEKEPLSAVTTNIGRTKDFDRHWMISDTSPATNDKVNNENRPLAGDRKKAVEMMDSSWEPHDQSPVQNQKAVGAKPLRKGMESHWGFGDDENSHVTNGRKAEKSF